MDPVAPCPGSDVVDRVADAAGVSLHQGIRSGDAETHDIDERIAGVAVLERDFPTNRRYADAVAVPGDPGNHPFDGTARASAGRAVHRAEAQRVEQRDRPRTHREDVADDPAHTGGRSLIGLDEGRMIVRLDLEHGCEAAADIHRAGVLSRTLQHAGAPRRQLLQVNPRALVAAVLGPHHGKNTQLRQ